MKSNKTFLLFTFFACTLFTVSCKKEEQKSSDSSIGTTNITGQVEYEVDYANTGYEKGPTGLIIAEISTWDLLDSPSTTGTSPKQFFNGTILNGVYSVNVSVGNKPISIKLYPQDFEDDRIISSTVTQRTIYTSPTTTLTGVPSGTKIVDFLYN